MVGGVLCAALVGGWWFTAARSAPAPGMHLSDEELAATLIRDPARVLRPGHSWQDLPGPARIIWSTWRFELMAGGTIPWSVEEGMPSVSEMQAGCSALGLPQAAELVATCDAAAAGGTGARSSACQAQVQAMRGALAGARNRYVNAHLHELAMTVD